MKQAYEKNRGEYREIEALPECKRVIEPLYGTETRPFITEYQLVKRKVFFGLFTKTYWLDKDYIKWCDKPTVEYYECERDDE